MRVRAFFVGPMALLIPRIRPFFLMLNKCRFPRAGASSFSAGWHPSWRYWLAIHGSREKSSLRGVGVVFPRGFFGAWRPSSPRSAVLQPRAGFAALPPLRASRPRAAARPRFFCP